MTNRKSICITQLILISALVVMYKLFINQDSYWGQYLNIPSLLFVSFTTLLLQIVNGDFKKFWTLNGTREITNRSEDVELHKKVSRTIMYLLSSSFTYFILQLIDVLKNSSYDVLFTNVGSALCSLLYGAIGSLILLPLLRNW